MGNIYNSLDFPLTKPKLEEIYYRKLPRYYKVLTRIKDHAIADHILVQVQTYTLCEYGYELPPLGAAKCRPEKINLKQKPKKRSRNHTIV